MYPPPPDWYPDPQNPTAWRWWDGFRWTGHSSSGAGGRAVQPLAETRPEVRSGLQVIDVPVRPLRGIGAQRARGLRTFLIWSPLAVRQAVLALLSLVIVLLVFLIILENSP